VLGEINSYRALVPSLARESLRSFPRRPQGVSRLRDGIAAGVVVRSSLVSRSRVGFTVHRRRSVPCGMRGRIFPGRIVHRTKCYEALQRPLLLRTVFVPGMVDLSCGLSHVGLRVFTRRRLVARPGQRSWRCRSCRRLLSSSCLEQPSRRGATGADYGIHQQYPGLHWRCGQASGPRRQKFWHAWLLWC